MWENFFNVLFTEIGFKEYVSVNTELFAGIRYGGYTITIRSESYGILDLLALIETVCIILSFAF